MNTYKLLTPGPLTTTMTVKEQMLFDHCTWDDDYKAITQEIRAELVRLGHCDPAAYTAVLMQGSGTFGDEAVLTGVVGDDEKVRVKGQNVCPRVLQRRLWRAQGGDLPPRARAARGLRRAL